MKTDIFAIKSTCMEVSVSLSCLFVHEPPYQTTVVCCNAVFRRGSSRMDHRTVFHVRVGLAQARPNYLCIRIHLPKTGVSNQIAVFAMGQFHNSNCFMHICNHCP